MTRIAWPPLLACAALLLATPAPAQDPNAALDNEVVVAQLPGRSIAGLVSTQPGAKSFTHGLVLFPGSPGYGNLRAEDGEIKYGQRGNFLVRARRHFIEDGVLTVVIDAPSDQQGKFSHAFRETPRYGDDVQALLDAVSKKYGPLEWTFIGTSEGSVSAAYAAGLLPALPSRVILTASLVSPSGGGRGLEVSDVRKIKVPVLWVHHRDDPCRYTPYFRVRNYAEETKTPLLTVTGTGNAYGNACEPYTQHGFIGVEIKTAKAILEWIRTGRVPPDVTL
jgi:pimeloyl-ACP methyl ester carboxylesterase